MIKLAHPMISETEIASVTEVLKSGNLVQGERVKLFEEKVQNYLKVKHAIAVSSGTAALHLSLLALEIDRGDNIIAPDFTFPATTNVIELIGAETKLADIDVASFCIDTEKIESNINNSTRAIIPVHEFGNVCNMDSIIKIANKHGLYIIEDAACALGAEYNGKKVGTFGDLGCFSLHPRKAITTGEGGIVVTNHDHLARKVRSLRNHGSENINGELVFTSIGLNHRMTDFQAAIGCGQLDRLEKIIERRKEIAQEYEKLIGRYNLDLIPPQSLETNRNVYQTYFVLFKTKVDQKAIVKFARERDIEINIGAHCIHRQPYYKNKYKFSDNQFPNSVRVFEQGMALPIHDDMKTDDAAQVVRMLSAYLNNH